MASKFSKGLFYILASPYYLLAYTYEGVKHSLNDDERKAVASNQEKIRPPRFVSFSLELEPYSIKKAYALEILNTINFEVFGTETIHETFTIDRNELIFTGKRIICVQDINKEGYRNESMYQHWNIFFKDILKVEIRMYDLESKRALAKEEEERMLNDPANEVKLSNQVRYQMKILYHFVDYENENGGVQEEEDQVIKSEVSRKIKMA
mmetsp:Transcript_375/g.425  ORF Transcript_375/g.425 Transcript_375/m.425 type:complete len:208 (+) Transcript_375:340-963(+)